MGRVKGNDGVKLPGWQQQWSLTTLGLRILKGGKFPKPKRDAGKERAAWQQLEPSPARRKQRNNTLTSLSSLPLTSCSCLPMTEAMAMEPSCLQPVPVSQSRWHPEGWEWGENASRERTDMSPVQAGHLSMLNAILMQRGALGSARILWTKCILTPCIRRGSAGLYLSPHNKSVNYSFSSNFRDEKQAQKGWMFWWETG